MTHWDNCKLESRALVHPAQCISSLVDLNLCPFLVVNCNCGCKAFPETVNLSSQLLNLRVVLGPPSLVRSEDGLGDSHCATCHRHILQPGAAHGQGYVHL